MGKYLLQRLATIVPTLFFVSVLIFGLQQLLPGDPAIALAGEDRDPNVVAYLRAKFHLDEPLPVRYGYWLGGVLRGDLGESVRIQKPVTELILEKLPVTIELAALAMLIALVIGVTECRGTDHAFSSEKASGWPRPLVSCRDRHDSDPQKNPVDA